MLYYVKINEISFFGGRGGVGWGLIIVTQVQLWCFELALREKCLMFESVT